MSTSAPQIEVVQSITLTTLESEERIVSKDWIEAQYVNLYRKLSLSRRDQDIPLGAISLSMKALQAISQLNGYIVSRSINREEKIDLTKISRTELAAHLTRQLATLNPVDAARIRAQIEAPPDSKV